jgi:hypothetical protein
MLAVVPARALSYGEGGILCRTLNPAKAGFIEAGVLHRSRRHRPIAPAFAGMTKRV